MCHIVVLVLVLAVMSYGCLVSADRDRTLTQRRTSTRSVCSRDAPDTTASRTPGDGGMRIQVMGHASRYSPGQVYTVAINGSYPNQRLVGFMLVAVPLNAKDESTTLGTFQHIDSTVTRFVPYCPHIVTHSDVRQKNGVEVLWTAPGPRVGCIEFRATVMERRDVWFKDDGALIKIFCEETAVATTQSAVSGQEVVDDCCACGTAKYQMSFEGRWNQTSHPKDYPTQRRLLHWSNLVGASHSKNYMIWQYGAYASKGVKEVCEFGYPRGVEEEIQKNSRDVRSVIKTTGIWWREPEGLDQLRQSRFSTDRRRHLVSMLTMIGPSPDWCVGISAVNLCLPNCTWASNLQVNLYPWDAGTDDGITYMASNAKSDPQQKIHKITNQFPSDERSPFYGSKPVKPLALLRIERISPPEEHTGRPCVDSDTTDSDTDFIGTGGADGLSDMDKQKQMMMAQGDGKCAVSAWDDWSSCSVTCAVGQRFRKRMYLNPMVDESLCGLPTMESENCIGVENECETVDEDCAVTQWSSWSPCSVTCGKGMKERRRYYLNKEDMARCDRTTEENEICMSRILDCDQLQSIKNYTAICSLPSLSGPCRGDFERWYYDIYMKKCLPFSYGGCRGNDNKFETMDECVEACQLRQRSEERRDGVANLTPPGIDDCLLPADRGPCSRFEEQWSFDKVMQKCLPFLYGGCHGNKNRFATESECTQLCGPLADDFQPSANSRASRLTLTTRVPPFREDHRLANTRQTQATSSNAHANNRRDSRLDDPPVDCMLSPWSEWSECNVTCGNGYQFQQRMVKREPENGGKKCPSNLEVKRKCTQPACVTNRSLSTLPPSRTTSTLVKTSLLGLKVDCVMSPWSSWSECSATCGMGYQFQRRTVTQRAANGGKTCPQNVQKKKKCILPICVNGCQLSDWGPWNACSKTCGNTGIQERERRVLHDASLNGQQQQPQQQPQQQQFLNNGSRNATQCAARLQRRICSLPPCP